MYTTMGAATARAPMEKPAALNAPLFRRLIGELETAGRHVVLDLGAANTPMLSLLAKSGRCRVEIADLAGGGEWQRLNADDPPVSRGALAASLLPAHETAEGVDLVFCWDILNYLRPDALAGLMQAVAARAAPAARAHALIGYADRTMGSEPASYVPTDGLHLVDRRPVTGQIDAPRYSPEELGRLMAGFTIEQARLLANGMQEFVLRLAR